MPAAFIWFLFDWRGRIGRSSYRISLLVFAIFIAVIHFSPIRASGFLLGMTVTQLVVQAALDAKRLHDIGRSAAWVVATSAACVALGLALVLRQPEAALLLRESMADTIGTAAADSPLACVLFAGLGLAGGLRSAWLWAPNSHPDGAIYDYDPRAGYASADAQEGGSSLDADALIAKALSESAIALRQVSSVEKRSALPGARKPFGRRAG